MRATAAVLYEVRKPVVVEDVEVMDPGPHEVLVRWAANGVCHSDLHVITGDYPHPLPVVLGHEAAGVVEKIGAGRRDGEGGRSRLLELYPVLRALRLLHRRAAHHVRAPRQAAVVHARRHLALPPERPAASTTSCRSRATRPTRCCPSTSVIPIRADAPLDVVCLVSCGVLAGAGPVFNRAKVPPGASVAVWGAAGSGSTRSRPRACWARARSSRWT